MVAVCRYGGWRPSMHASESSAEHTPVPAAKRLQQTMRITVRGSPRVALGGRQQCRSSKAYRDAAAFVFCGPESLSIADLEQNGFCKSSASSASDEAVEQHEAKRVAQVSFVEELPKSAASLRHAAVSSVAMSIPMVVAAHHGIPLQSQVAMSCMPLMIPFRVPQVSPQSWMANKRALAFHRMCVLIVYVQGGIALVRFAQGDLIGGIYDAVQALMGGYAIQPESISFMPSYIMVCGFNGLLNFLQVVQNFHGVPIHFLPWMTIVPPIASLLGAYCGWQFSKEVRAIALGQQGDGPQDSCIVRLFAADWWPRNLLTPIVPGDGDGPGGGGGDGPSARPGFEAFAGNGQRLGSH